MGDEVYGNGMEISCKAGPGKTICAFPDVCFTPPTTPATPPGVPIPYPNTGMASDTTQGSKNVKIGGQEVMLKDRSYFKQSTGNEAGAAPKKGVVTSTNRGKVYFTSWSMDVKFESENVVRHFDLTTHNHNPPPGNSPPFPHVSNLSPPTLPDKPCKADCPKEPSPERKEELRKKSPSSQARKDVNKANPKKCYACGGSPANLAADHIVPLKIMMKMKGFACLPPEEQERVTNSPNNFVGLCKSCNSSKCDKLWHTWKGVKSRNLVFSDSVRTQARQRTNQEIKEIKADIKGTPCA